MRKGFGVLPVALHSALWWWGGSFHFVFKAGTLTSSPGKPTTFHPEVGNLRPGVPRRQHMGRKPWELAGAALAAGATSHPTVGTEVALRCP